MFANYLPLDRSLNRASVLIQDDHLVFLDHQGQRDRVRRLYFDKVESLLIWRSWPWGRILLTALICGGLLLALFMAIRGMDDKNLFLIFSLYILIPFVILETRFIALRKTNFKIVRRGHTHSFSVIAPGNRARTFGMILTINIKTAQLRAAKAALEKQREIIEREKSRLAGNAGAVEGIASPDDTPTVA